MATTLSPADLARRAKAQRPSFSVPAHPELMRYAMNFSRAAQGTSEVDPCMLAAIVHRESGGQNVLQFGMQPGPGCGVGLCQITAGVDWSNASTPVYPGFGLLLDVDVNLRVAAVAFLNPLLTQFEGNHIAAFAAYNAGAGAVQTALRAGRSADSVTTGGNYGSDVMATWLSFVAASLGTQQSSPVTTYDGNVQASPQPAASVHNRSNDNGSDLDNN